MTLNGDYKEPSDWTDRNIHQFEQDLGITREGALPNLANEGLEWAVGILRRVGDEDGAVS